MERGTIQLVHLCIGFLLASPIVYSAEFAGGTGTATDPYEIATAEQLISIGSDPNLLNKHFVLINDIDLDPNLSAKYGFSQPVIGTEGSGFSGVFDGSNFRIRHLTIKGNTGEESESLALFGQIEEGAEVKRLILEDVYVASGPDSTQGAASALCAWNYGVVFRCSVAGVVSGNDMAAGLVAGNLGIVEECRSACIVSGFESGGLINYNKGRVRNCYASGRVSGVIAGGLVAGIAGLTDHCYAACQVDDRSAFTGGLVGLEYRTSRTIDCYFLALSDRGGPDNGFGTPLTSLQMRQVGSFAGWDFWGIDNRGLQVTWFMPEDGYPELVWLAVEAIPDTSGLSLVQAYRIIEEAGIQIGEVVYDYDHALEAGNVIAVRPSSVVPPGSKVDIAVSLGPYDWSADSSAGDANNPYPIFTVGQLDCLTHEPQLWSKHFMLVCDLDMKWRVYNTALIGNSKVTGQVFDGSFDGDGHVIRNLMIETDWIDQDEPVMLGLFGEIGPAGRVNDLGLKNALIRGKEYREDIAGMLCAVNRGYISRCYSAGALRGYGHLGGLIGDNAGVIENCYATGEVEDLSFADWRGLYGGLVASNMIGTIRISYAACYVGAGDRAGFVARNEGGSIERSLWDREVSGTENSAGGKGLRTQELMDVKVLQENGWGGSPNWIVYNGKDYPRLVWEGTPGNLIPWARPRP